MKILVTFPGDRLTGAGRYAADICRELMVRHHEVMVAVHGDGPATREFLAVPLYQPEVRRVEMPNLRRSVRTSIEYATGVVTGVAQLSQLITEFRPDVIFAHCIYNIWSALAASKASVPLVSLVHELSTAFPAPLYRAWDALLCRTATRVIVGSETMKAGLPASSLKTVVIAPGIDDRVFRPDVDGRAVRTELLDGATGPLVLCVSHIMKGKGQREVVEALPRVLAKFPDARMVFIGGTNDIPKNEAYLEGLHARLRELRIESRVSFAGERTDMAAVFAAASVVVYPSRRESFGLVGVEASAVGTPVVTADVGVMRILASQCSRVEVVPPNDVKQLAEAIVRACGKTRGEKKLGVEWTIQRCVDQLEGVIREAIDLGTTKIKERRLTTRARRLVTLAKERVTSPSFDKIRSVNLAITYYCNSRCTMCSIWEIYKKDRAKAAAELSLEDIKQIFSSRYFAHLRSVALTGGEPFLRRDLDEIVGFFLTKFAGISLVIPTDSVSPKLTIESVKRIVERYRPGRSRLAISVSLDGLRETHDRQRGVACFDKALEVLHALKTMDLALNVSYTITPLNGKDVVAVYRLVSELGAVFNVQFAQGSSNYYGEKSTSLRKLREDELNRVGAQILEIADDRWATMPLKSRLTDTSDYFLRRMVDYQRDPRRIFKCYSGTHSCFIDPYGDVYPCLMLDRKLGSAKRDGFDAVWSGLIAVEVRNSIAREECHCWTPCETCPSLGRSLDPIPALTRLARPHANRHLS